MQDHYSGIVAGYALTTGAIWGLWRLARPLVANSRTIALPRPWMELGLFAGAVVLTLVIGQAFVAGRLLPGAHVVPQSLNQFIIFLPILILIASHPQRLESGGLPFGQALIGLPIGLVLACASILAYATARGIGDQAYGVFAYLFSARHIPSITQVLLEDIAVAALLLWIRGAAGPTWTVSLVALLFAAAHIPAMLASGTGFIEGLPSLIISIALGLMVMGAVLKTQSVWWVWPVHSCMDLLQFYRPA